MSNSPFGEDELDASWGIAGQGPGALDQTRKSSEDALKEALKKEQLIKEVLTAQADLRALVDRVDKTQSQIDKLSSNNVMLATYVDNLSKQMAGNGTGANPVGRR